jgi:hypothetical protein
MKYQIVGREEYEPKMCETTYALGHSSAEIQRLKRRQLQWTDLKAVRDAVIEARSQIYGPSQVCALGGSKQRLLLNLRAEVSTPN